MNRPTKLVLTTHALERYHERWRPQMSRAESDAECRQQVAAASFVEIDGRDLIYQAPRGALLTVAHEGDVGVVRTVLPMGSKKTTYRPRRR